MFPCRHGVRSPTTSSGPKGSRTGGVMPLFALASKSSVRTWSSSLPQSAAVHVPTLPGSGAQKWPLKCVPISLPSR